MHHHRAALTGTTHLPLDAQFPSESPRYSPSKEAEGRARVLAQEIDFNDHSAILSVGAAPIEAATPSIDRVLLCSPCDGAGWSATIQDLVVCETARTELRIAARALELARESLHLALTAGLEISEREKEGLALAEVRRNGLVSFSEFGTLCSAIEQYKTHSETRMPSVEDPKELGVERPSAGDSIQRLRLDREALLSSLS